MHFADVWIEGVRMANYYMQAGTICRRDNRIAFLKRQSQWFLDQNMLSLFHRFNRLPRVKSMRRCDVDSLNRGIPTQIMKVRIDRCVELLSECFAWAGQRIHSGTERDSWMCYRGANHEGSSEPKPCDSEPNRQLCGVASRFNIHEVLRDAGRFRTLEQRAERAVEQHDVVESYGPS